MRFSLNKIFLALPACILSALVGGLIGLVVGWPWVGVAVGFLLPILWLAFVFFMLAVGLMTIRQLFDSTRPPD